MRVAAVTPTPAVRARADKRAEAVLTVTALAAAHWHHALTSAASREHTATTRAPTAPQQQRPHHTSHLVHAAIGHGARTDGSDRALCGRHRPRANPQAGLGHRRCRHVDPRAAARCAKDSTRWAGAVLGSSARRTGRVGRHTKPQPPEAAWRARSPSSVRLARSCSRRTLRSSRTSHEREERARAGMGSAHRRAASSRRPMPTRSVSTGFSPRAHSRRCSRPAPTCGSSARSLGSRCCFGTCRPPWPHRAWG